MTAEDKIRLLVVVAIFVLLAVFGAVMQAPTRSCLRSHIEVSKVPVFTPDGGHQVRRAVCDQWLYQVN